MELYIDTSDKTVIEISDLSGQILASFKAAIASNQTDELLKSIDRLFSQNNISKSQLKLVRANCGPGSYTGIRVGVTTANLIAFALNIPVYCSGGKRPKNNHFSIPIKAKYLNEPFISKAKPGLK